MTVAKKLASPTNANLSQYKHCYKNFDWQRAERLPTGLPNGGLNVAYEAVDRHLADGLADKIALRWISQHNEMRQFSYRDLFHLSNRFASALQHLGLAKGARVYSLLERVPELYITALGTWKAGCIFTPLLSALGPQPIQSRVDIGAANVLVTTRHLFEKKIAPWWQQSPSLTHILLIDADPEQADELQAALIQPINTQVPHCLHSYSALMTAAINADFTCFETQADDIALLHFTSGNTGNPKGVIHVHEAVKQHMMSAYYALNLHLTDTYWCTADPGCMTGTCYGIIAPLCLGATMIVDEAEFNSQRCYSLLQQHQVNVLYTAPAAIRMLMQAGNALREAYQLDALRFIASAGERLNPETVILGEQTFGMPIHDNWCQTETGGIMIANFIGETVKPGSMGQPLPGITAAIMVRDSSGRLQVSTTANEAGELALAIDWPSMFRGYINQPQSYQQCFEGGWYLSGDSARRDEDGYFWFIGRAGTAS